MKGEKDGIDMDNFVRLYGSGIEAVLMNKAPIQLDTTQKRVGLDITFENLCLSVKKGDKDINVVNNCTGRLRSNTLTALLGGSGAGKVSVLGHSCDHRNVSTAS
jgi:ABC-type transport system involved in cytochrome bd biosynthesis fused ATPase/permease subunit